MGHPPLVEKVRKTAMVTIAGALFLIVAFFFAVLTGFAVTSGPIEAARLVFDVVVVLLALLFGYTGLATMTRWRGWRIWLGAVSWSLLVLDGVLFIPVIVSKSISDTAVNGLLVAVQAVLTIVPIFALMAKRMEKRESSYDPAAIFG